MTTTTIMKKNQTKKSESTEKDFFDTDSDLNTEKMNDLSWKLIDKYFTDNPNNLVAHHLDSFNEFFEIGIQKIFRENNPIRFKESDDPDEFQECFLYLGGKDGTRIYTGKPIIYDNKFTHYMYPNDARLRNMTYGATIHYDVEVVYKKHEKDTTTMKNKIQKKVTETTSLLEKIYLGKFPIMLQSNLCILYSLDRQVRYQMGECLNDYGGYFIINGKEKVILPQEEFADNMIYVREYKKEDAPYSHSAEIRSVSEDVSKQIRTTAVRMVNPSDGYSNRQIVVSVPNVTKPVPLFILMRALGINSDKDIIQTCLLDLDKNKDYIELFTPSIHDANEIFTQKAALDYMKIFTKTQTNVGIQYILSDYFLPHIGELNLLDKAYFIGYMVYRMLNVVMKLESPTDRDSYLFKRVKLSGSLLYDLFREYYLIQKREITQKIEKKYYYTDGIVYTGDNFHNLIEENVTDIFHDRTVEKGLKKGFNGNWGSLPQTKRLGVVQDLNRLSWNSFLSHLRKTNLEMPATSKVIAPRQLNSTQWGYIDPVDSPDGANIGFHKHLSITTYITSNASSIPLIQWMKEHIAIKSITECNYETLSYYTKIFVNGNWIGVTEDPISSLDKMKLFRRNGMIPIFTSISFQYKRNEIYVYTDAGRMTRPIYYIENGKISFDRKNVKELFKDPKWGWREIISGLKEKKDPNFDVKKNKVYFSLEDLYDSPPENNIEKFLKENRSVVDFMDTSEEESALIAFSQSDLEKTQKSYHTHIEIEPSLIFGVMGNQVIYPENNQLPRNVFSCGQSRQAVSMYHTNYQNRMDKMGVILNYGQTPLIKSKYIEYMNHEQNPYGINAIVAIMCYSGYNVEDAILINEGAVARGLFRTTYFTTYQDHEETTIEEGTYEEVTKAKFANIQKTNGVVRIKEKYDYSLLDDRGLIPENTPVSENVVLIGKIISNMEKNDSWIDSSIATKKGQSGFVDKAFLTESEEGFNVAKVRVREERIPAIGDKMASRAGQKGTIGLLIPEEDMPFTADGIRPDLIINPHALPSRMTIGQLVECLFGKVCAMYGAFGDSTPFQSRGPGYDVYGKMLVEEGFNATGNQLLYNGQTGEQIHADIFIGPTYYMRLKHMVKDKINYRARGPNAKLTRQPIGGRANDGGLRIGEMERDGVLAHGASYFLNESFMNRGDEYYMAICNKTGAIAAYNPNKKIFLSPLADGPLVYNTNPNNPQEKIVENVSKFGRSFSIVRVPYSFKLLMQELQVMNIQMRLITEDNVDQVMNMAYSRNIETLLNMEEGKKMEPEVIAKRIHEHHHHHSIGGRGKTKEEKEKEKKKQWEEERKKREEKERISLEKEEDKKREKMAEAEAEAEEEAGLEQNLVYKVGDGIIGEEEPDYAGGYDEEEVEEMPYIPPRPTSAPLVNVVVNNGPSPQQHQQDMAMAMEREKSPTPATGTGTESIFEVKKLGEAVGDENKVVKLS
jgi:DNA-directed RNA polymerase II subunit RPB2